MDTELPRHARPSWWMEEALAHDPGEPCPPHTGDETADVVILGGGYTGMWTAHFLKERDPGVDVLLAERDVCGGGPSGRNGGFCNGLWEDLPALVSMLGEERATRTCRVAERSVPEIGTWCERYGVDAWFQMRGHMGVATSPAQDGAWRATVELARRLGVAEGRFEELAAAQVADRCRSPLFGAGMLTPYAATVQPARLVRGLRRVLLEQGVRVREGTTVLRFRGGSPVEVHTSAGRIRAGAAVLGLGAFAAGLRRFRRTILPRGSYIILTAPIPERLEELGWTGGEGIYDFRTALHYLRTTRDGRLAFGAASSRAGLGTGIGPRLDYDGVSVRRLVRDLGRMFPTLRDVPLEAAWGGPIDVTGAHVPFFGTLPGGVHYGLGFTGGGVGPCHLAGRILSALALGMEDEYSRLPLVGMEPRPFPPEPLLSVGAFLTHEAIVRKDEAEDLGRRPNPVVDAMARLPRRLGYELGP
ncbi:MAG TPA: FAD-binding oxidoreductase [Actinomycetota bacterium]